MYCPNCGTELPNWARFCSSCGTRVMEGETQGVPSLAQQEEISQPPSSLGAKQELQMEYAEVRWEASYPGCSGFLWGVFISVFLNRYQFRLEAIATGPHGRYHVAYSPHFVCRGNLSMGGGAMEGEPALAALTDELLQEGWQPIPGGPLWWQAMFQRLVRV